MSDYERYGDYNNIEDDEPRSKSPVMLILKILTAAVCITVVGILAFRLIVFNKYPEEVSGLYFNGALREYYGERGEDMDIKTQKLRYVYDDPEVGNFFCDYLYVIEDIDQLQITVRYNTSTVTRISEELGVELDADDFSIFEYRLADNYGKEQGRLVDTVTESQAMYRYVKLVFEGVSFSPDGGEAPEWIRLETTVRGTENAYTYNLIYENHADYNTFEKYIPTKKELEAVEG